MLITYTLKNINYSPKKLKVFSKHIKGKLNLLIHKFLTAKSRKSGNIIIKFLKHIYVDTLLKYGQKNVYVLYCHTGRSEIIKKLDFAAKGKLTHSNKTKSNLTIIIGFNG